MKLIFEAISVTILILVALGYICIDVLFPTLGRERSEPSLVTELASEASTTTAGAEEAHGKSAVPDSSLAPTDVGQGTKPLRTDVYKGNRYSTSTPAPYISLTYLDTGRVRISGEAYYPWASGDGYNEGVIEEEVSFSEGKARLDLPGYDGGSCTINFTLTGTALAVDLQGFASCGWGNNVNFDGSYYLEKAKPSRSYTTSVSDDRKSLFIHDEKNGIVAQLSMQDIPSFDRTEGVPADPESDYKFAIEDSRIPVPSPAYDSEENEIYFAVINEVNSGTGFTSGGILKYNVSTRLVTFVEKFEFVRE